MASTLVFLLQVLGWKGLFSSLIFAWSFEFVNFNSYNFNVWYPMILKTQFEIRFILEASLNLLNFNSSNLKIDVFETTNLQILNLTGILVECSVLKYSSNCK